jgi:hypothetical protein
MQVGELKLLVPTNLTEINDEVLAAITKAARDGDISVTLLHVVSGERQGASCEEAQRALLALERRFLSREMESRVAVRCGELLAEMLAEAQRIEADAILLSRSAAAELVGRCAVVR